MTEPLIRRIAHGVVNDPKLKQPQFCSMLTFGDGEDDVLICRSAIYPEYVENDMDGWFHLCATGMRHQTALFNKLLFGATR